MNTFVVQPLFKWINYRGGIVRFQIPSDWIEEYEAAGGGTFYENRADSGTLRLNVLGFNSPKEVTNEVLLSVFKDTPDKVQTLPGGFLIRHYIKQAVEEGQNLDFHRWEIAVPMPPNDFRLVVFAHTILSGQQSDPRIAEELAMLDRNIRSAEYSQKSGESGLWVDTKDPVGN